MATTVRLARMEDAATVVSILHEAAAWLESQGTPMWRGHELRHAELSADVASDLFWIALADDDPAGVMKLQLDDPEFWPDVPPGESVVLHRLAVRRQFAGQSVSTTLMSFAVERARALGMRYLRLDCEARRPKLRAMYERFGFEHHSDRQVGPYFVSRYFIDVNGRSVTRSACR
jgi:GNAT superfamily N-acetyltransferase